MRVGALGSGSGANCEAIIEACEHGEIPGRVVVVLSDIADAKILARAERHGIPHRFSGPSQFKMKLKIEDRVVRILESRRPVVRSAA